MTQAHKTDREVVELLATLGKAYLENSENEKAADKFRQLLKLGVADKETVCNFALALARNEATNDEALDVYRKAVALESHDESLYVTLATLFLKADVFDEPALPVFRRVLKFSPPFEAQVRDALERIFQETTDTITVPEIRQTLMDSIDNPELLSLYLTAAWREEKYDETVDILKDLHAKSNQSDLYLDAICKTLLEKKADYEKIGRKFALTASEASYCLKLKDIEKSIQRIAEIELYLDLKNLFLAFTPKPEKSNDRPDEYEILLSDDAINHFQEITETQNINIEVDNRFTLDEHFIRKFTSGAVSQNSDFIDQLNTVAIFEICNFDPNADAARLPVRTFLNLMSKKLVRDPGTIQCMTADGMISLSNNPQHTLDLAIETLTKLESYNQVVDDSEVIKLHVTLHCNTISFMDLEKQGIQELRKAFKVHGLHANDHIERKDKTSTHALFLTEPVSRLTHAIRLKHVGAFKLPHFPDEHDVYAIWPEASETDSSVKGGSGKQNFGKYEVIEPIHERALYSTFRGYDPQLQRPVIIKAYQTHAFARFKDLHQLKKQFYEEVRKLNKITHPNVGVIYDAGEDGDVLYLVREFIEGKNLRAHLAEVASDIETTLEPYVRICRVVAAFHKHKIWHKNLKPSNMFVTPQEELKVVDGGLLQVRHTDKFSDQDEMYAAPEQIQGRELTRSCDVFQLGVMLYETLTGTHPFHAESITDFRIKILADDAPPASNHRDDISESLDMVLSKALAKNPEQRYATVEEFEEALKRNINDEESTARQKLMELLE